MDAETAFETHLEPAAAHGRLVSTPWGAFGLFERSDGTYCAVDAWCPHVDGPLWQGTFGGDDELACPWHAWRYSTRTGRCTWAPPSDCEEARASTVRILAVTPGPRGTLVVHPPRAE
ncbi:MAG: Rieske 2Fe-2S domain-containing protein [Planctomycetota bacterium]